MSTLGLIVEYNPLHNGHLYHFNTSLDLTQAEYSICVMSGNFVQRGEPAIVDKWSRARMALMAGLDLVIELPAVYCIQSAEIFAYGAVSLLNSLGIVDKICFGSESGDMGILEKVAKIISQEPDMYREGIRHGASAGNSFAVSRANAILRYMEDDMSEQELEELRSMLQSSNNILALEYIKWLHRLNSPVIPVTVKRLHSGYNDVSTDTPFASALAVRKSIRENNMDIIGSLVPDFTLDILKKQFSTGMGPVFIDSFSQAILCQIRKMPAEDISRVMDVGEGLENRIKKAALSSGNIDELVNSIKSKRYAETRIKRILVHILLGMYKRDLIEARNSSGPLYIRILGFSEKGKYLISKIKRISQIPVITNASDYKKYNNHVLRRVFELDTLSTDIYASAYSENSLRIGGYDFYNKPVMI